MKARFDRSMLAELEFIDDPAPLGDRRRTPIKTLFLEWLEIFQGVPNEQKWASLSLQGTHFQQSVWKALMDIPLGASVCYSAIAKQLGKPAATRAIGNAVGANAFSILIPCHRVLPRVGGIGNYRWGADRKAALLEAEAKPNTDLLSLFL